MTPDQKPDQTPDLKKLKDVGGTPGGLVEFIIGLSMAAAGLYLLTTHMMVRSGWDQRYGGGTPVLLAALVGFGLVFFNGKSRIGWGLILAGVGFAMFNVLANLTVTFRSTTLWDTLLMFVLFGGGLGLVFKSVRPHQT